MSQVKKVVKKVFRIAGFDVTRAVQAPTGALPPPSLKNYYFEADEIFKSIYREGIKISGSLHDPETVHQRMYNAVEFLRYSLDLEGDVVECGAFRGLSSYVFCQYIRLACPDFEGAGYHIFDSFEGLSEPSEQDAITDEAFGAVGTHCQSAGAFHGGLDTVKATLRDFPSVKYHPGWIPQSFTGLAEREYKFVHVDLDLYDPIKGAVEYFYPRLVRGGVIVIDEYGIPRWPGARRAVDEFCHAHGLTTPICLTTGNGVLVKK